MPSDDKLKFVRPNVALQTTGDLLDDVEKLLGKLDAKNGDLAERILSQFDEIDQRLKESYRATEIPLDYSTQWEYVSQRVLGLAPVLIRALGGKEQLILKRERVHKQPDAWWWYLDDYLASIKKKRVRRTLISVGIGAVVLAAVVTVYQLFLAPPPEVRARLRYEQDAQRLLEAGDYAGALTEIEGALAVAPENYDLHVQRGVILLKLGEMKLASEAFAQGRALSTNEEHFYLARSFFEFMVGLPDDALADAEMALEINPESPEGYLYKAQGLEMMGEYERAFEAYELAAMFAEEQADAQIYATARMRLGMIMQGAPGN